MKHHSLVAEFVIVSILLVLTLFPRLYRITYPLTDWHSWRQADTASVTREFVKHGIDLLHPTFQDLSNIQSNMENPQGYRMVEFPLLNAGTALLIRTFHLEKNEVIVGRSVSIFFSLITALCIYVIGRNLTNKRVGVFATLLFAVLPYSVYYGRTILPDVPMLSFAMIAFVFHLLWLRSKNKGWIWYLLSLISFATALLLKPFVLVFALVFAALSVQEKGKKALALPGMYLFPLLALVPFVLWRQWMVQYPAGIPGSSWLFNETGLRFTGAFWHWLFEVRVFSLMLGIGLVVPCVMGLVRKGKDWLVYVSWAVAMFAYLAIVAGGNIRHDYYQIMLIPFLVLTVARGMDTLLRLPSTLVHPLAVKASLVLLTAFSIFVSWYVVRGYFNVNKWELTEAGQAIDRLTPPDAKVIAPYGADTAFLFQTNRTGWPVDGEIEKRITQGATYYASITYDDETNAVMKTYQVIEKTPRYVIVKLQKHL